jgi:hypothetical protein
MSSSLAVVEESKTVVLNQLELVARFANGILPCMSTCCLSCYARYVALYKRVTWRVVVIHALLMAGASLNTAKFLLLTKTRRFSGQHLKWIYATMLCPCLERLTLKTNHVIYFFKNKKNSLAFFKQRRVQKINF